MMLEKFETAVNSKQLKWNLENGVVNLERLTNHYAKFS